MCSGAEAEDQVKIGKQKYANDKCLCKSENDLVQRKGITHKSCWHALEAHKTPIYFLLWSPVGTAR